MPWIDHIKTYRQPAASLARNLPTSYGCIASVNVADPVLASLDYFEGIRTVPAASPAATKLRAAPDPWLAEGRRSDGGRGWRKIWQGRRPSDRRESEKVAALPARAASEIGERPELRREQATTHR
jgi:hypothetical protein